VGMGSRCGGPTPGHGGAPAGLHPERGQALGGAGEMNSTKLIADLCGIIDRMNVILQAQAMELAQLDALRHEEEIEAIRRDYAQAIGEVKL